MRFVVVPRLGRLGEGLGNEMMGWAKGSIASDVLGATLVGPAWGLNWRKYYRNFRTSRADFIAEEILKRLPHESFTEADYWATGEVDFGRAIEQWAHGKKLFERRNFIVTVGGMYGGYPAIHNARPFLWAKLLNSRDTIRNIFQISNRLDRNKLFVTVHMRSTVGGHNVVSASEDVRGRFNIVVPGEWYLHVAQKLKDEFGDRLQFHIFTDKGSPEYDEAVRRFNPGQPKQTGLTECSDLLLMAQADLRICSISSYSLIASFLSGGPYIWYEPQLTVEDDLYSLWGFEENQRKPGSMGANAAAFARSFAPSVDAAAGMPGHAMGPKSEVPPGLVIQLQRKLSSIDPRTNLLDYGVLPRWADTIE